MSRTFRVPALFALAVLLFPLFALADEAPPPATLSSWLSLLFGFAMLLPTVYTGLTRYQRAPGVYGWVKAVFDFLSFVVHADSPGTLSFPGMSSPPPLGTPSSGPATRIDPSPPSRQAPGGNPFAAFLVLVMLSSAAHADELRAPAAAASPVLVLAPPPQPTDPVQAKLAALEEALRQVQVRTGAPTQIPSAFWDTPRGQALAVTLNVAVCLVSAAGSAAGVYAAFR